MPIHHRADIEGLRGIAVLSVVAYHLSSGLLAGGFVGVDVFFVLSGYLISRILLRDLADKKFSLVRFYSRRIRRIFPALLVVLATTWLIGWFTLLPGEYAELGKHIGGASIFISNFILWKEAGYFDAAAELKPLLHLWSLGVEEQFYLLFPLLLALVSKNRFCTILFFVVCIAVTLGLSISLSPSNPVHAFYLPHTRMWELLLGSMLAYYQTIRPVPAKPGTANAFSIIGTRPFAFSMVGFNHADDFPGWRALLPTCGALLILAASTSWLNLHLYGQRGLRWFGNISYALYLWHWPLLAYLRILSEREPSIAARGAAVALAVLLAWLTTRYIEKPIRFGQWRSSRFVIFNLLAAMVVCGLLGLVTLKTHGFVALRKLDLNQFHDLQKFDAFRKTQHPCTAADTPKNVSLVLTSKPGAPTMAIFGDSHADHLFPGLSTRDTARNWLLIGTSSCPPVTYPSKPAGMRDPDCTGANDASLKYVIARPEIRTVLISSYSSFYLEQDYLLPGLLDRNRKKLAHAFQFTTESRALREQQLYEGLGNSIRALEAAGKQVVLVMDVPEFNFPPERCLSRPAILAPNPEPCSLARERILEHTQSHRNVITRLAKSYPKTRVFDSYDTFCDASKCYAEQGDVLYYHDSHHLSHRGSNKLADSLLTFLK